MPNENQRGVIEELQAARAHAQAARWWRVWVRNRYGNVTDTVEPGTKNDAMRMAARMHGVGVANVTRVEPTTKP